MSDFLISCKTRHKAADMLALLKMPYTTRRVEGKAFDYSWGAVAVLNEIGRPNIHVEKDGSVAAWVGEIIGDFSTSFVGRLKNEIGQLEGGSRAVPTLETNEVFSKLNGAFAAVLASENGAEIITDLKNFVTVYAGYDKDGSLSALGTHLDLVAAMTDDFGRLEPVLVAEWLNFAAVDYPAMMYSNIKRLHPAGLHTLRFKPADKADVRCYRYWSEPKELTGRYNEDYLAEELRESFKGAVLDRCRGDNIAVTLSGGLDSRLILACVPRDMKCTAITFCDHFNRETKVAEKVAQSYGVPWVPLFRHEEFLGENLPDIAKFTGGVSEFMHVHMFGLRQKLEGHNFSNILMGTQMDVYLKGYYAEDWARVSRAKGLLPPQFVKKPFDMTGEITDFWKGIFDEPIVDQIRARRQRHYDTYADPSRSSMAEWLYLHPVDKMFVSWSTERRVLPVSLVVLDRRLMDFCFKCPLELKFRGRIFFKAVMPLYGQGKNIPNANKGVRPGSGHISSLAQRAVRKIEESAAAMLERLGKEQKVQHSWHDYQRYWRESKVCDELAARYGANLDRFDGVLFKGKGREIVRRKDIYWQNGFRLLQLAVWLDTAKGFRSKFESLGNKKS
ncbi:MAG: asparagine synthase-related protein [Sedimentisphaerales bacterium]|nr:asparagine synthase-related protein [Sedimentisphaerales bacterium]